MKEWEKNFRQVKPYTPGEQPKQTDVIKLNTNENPYPPAPGVLKLMKELDGTALRKYPDPEAGALVSAASRFYGLCEDQVFTGVGSDDVLGMSFLTFFNGDKPVLFPNITYSFYDVWADLYRIPFETQRLDENLKIRKEDYFKENGGVVIANPNAPTGEVMNLSCIEEIIQKNQNSVVIIDEAYVDFGGETALPLISEYPNLLVVRTCSKSFSLAGLRVGFAFGDPNLISALNRVKYSYNSYTMNTPSILLGAEAFKDRDYFEMTRKKIIATRERSKREFRSLGFLFGDSQTNFIFVRHPGIHAEKLFSDLKDTGIYVRHFGSPLISDYLRITIGTDAEMDVLFDFLKHYPGIR